MSEAGFLADIIERPDDDTPRLVYADWLADQGQDERAELIRVQIERARLDEWDVRQVALARREEALLAEHGREWAGELTDCCLTWEYRRGFIEEVELNEVHWERAEHALARHPIQGIIGEGSGDMVAVLSSAGFRWPRRLVVEDEDAGDDLAELIGGDARAGRLVEVSLSMCELSARGVGLLLAGDLSALERLDVSFNEAIGPHGAARLLGPHMPPALRRLDLTSTGIGGATARRLAAVPGLRRLTHLEIGFNSLGPGAVALLASPGLAGLVGLDVSDSRLGPSGLAALAATPHLSALRELRVGACNITAAGLRSLMGNPALAGLLALDLFTNPVGPDGAALLASDESPWRLRSLDLRFCGLEDEGVAALDSPRLAGLHELILHANNVSAEGASRLASARRLGGLRVLGMKNNRVGEAGAEALARTGSLDLLKLEMETNKLSAEARAALRSRYGDGVTFSD